MIESLVPSVGSTSNVTPALRVSKQAGMVLEGRGDGGRQVVVGFLLEKAKLESGLEVLGRPPKEARGQAEECQPQRPDAPHEPRRL